MFTLNSKSNLLAWDFFFKFQLLLSLTIKVLLPQINLGTPLTYCQPFVMLAVRRMAMQKRRGLDKPVGLQGAPQQFKRNSPGKKNHQAPKVKVFIGIVNVTIIPRWHATYEMIYVLLGQFWEGGRTFQRTHSFLSPPSEWVSSQGAVSTVDTGLVFSLAATVSLFAVYSCNRWWLWNLCSVEVILTLSGCSWTAFIPFWLDSLDTLLGTPRHNGCKQALYKKRSSLTFISKFIVLYFFNYIGEYFILQKCLLANVDV